MDPKEAIEAGLQIVTGGLNAFEERASSNDALESLIVQALTECDGAKDPMVAIRNLIYGISAAALAVLTMFPLQLQQLAAAVEEAVTSGDAESMRSLIDGMRSTTSRQLWEAAALTMTSTLDRFPGTDQAGPT